MKTSIIITLMLLISLTGCITTTENNVVSVIPKETENLRLNVKAPEDKAFWAHRFNATNNIAYGKLPRQTLDIYRQGVWQGPPKYFVPTTKAKPTLIYIHGGAWHGGDKEASLWSIMPYVQAGWHVVNIEYRVGGNTAPQAADDVLLAFQWLAKHADEYAIDKDNIVVSGDSAGGHLALFSGLVNRTKSHTAYVGDKLNIKAIVNWFGVADIAMLNKYLDDNNQWNYPARWAGNYDMLENIVTNYSPINFVGANSPAVISIHGTADKVVPIEQSKKLHEKLSQFRVKNKLVTLEGGRHLGFNEQQYQTIYNEIFSFVNHVMGN